jgi:3-oxoacyl-[acyl-carrier protein] reductase
MDLYLKQRTAVVTGASQGIGAAIVKELALEGVRVFATARDEQLLSTLSKEIVEIGGREPIIFTQDLTTTQAPGMIADAALAALGHVDILINNAGRSQPVAIADVEQPWLDGMTLDFERPRQLTQRFLPHMIDRRQGVILNLTSTYELRTLNVSAIAKGAIAIWSKQLAGEVGKHGIRVNCLQPGLIDTANIRRFFNAAERKAYAEAEIALGDFGDVQDMANMAVFLVSPRASYVTGSVVAVDGGANKFAF